MNTGRLSWHFSADRVMKKRGAKDLRKKKTLGRLKVPEIPGHAWACLAASLSVQLLVYYGTRLLLPGRTLYHLESAWDLRIPVIPWWILIYYLAFASWLVSALVIFSGEKRLAVRFACAYICALLVSGVIFLLWPGTLTRPEVAGSDVFSVLLRGLYETDSPTNLCPSLHVMISYFCWRGLRIRREIPAWCRRVNLVFLVLVCFSILFIKQHVLIDIPAAVLVGELSLQGMNRWKPERLFLREESEEKI